MQYEYRKEIHEIDSKNRILSSERRNWNCDFSSLAQWIDAIKLVLIIFVLITPSNRISKL